MKPSVFPWFVLLIAAAGCSTTSFYEVPLDEELTRPDGLIEIRGYVTEEATGLSPAALRPEDIRYVIVERKNPWKVAGNVLVLTPALLGGGADLRPVGLGRR